MKAARLSVCVLVPALLTAGCQTTGDPREGGFISGVAGVSGGGYQQMVDKTQAELDAEEDVRRDLQAKYGDRRSESDRLAAKLEELGSRLASLQGNVADLETRVAAAQSEKKRREYDALQRRVAAADQKARAIKVSNALEPAKQTETDALERSIDLLTDDLESLSRSL